MRRIVRYPVICGPTAGGKSDLAVDVALMLGGEVVTADALQVYRGMDIGTAKPTAEERRGVPHHLIDLVEPSEDGFTVARWLAAARSCVEAVHARGRVPVVVGGTHLYIKALMEGLFEGPPPDETLRAMLQAMPAHELRAELERVDPQAAARIHPNDSRRTIRAIEVYRQTGKPISAWQGQWVEGGTERDSEGARQGVSGRVEVGDVVLEPRLVGIEWAVEELNRRINARVRGMMERGLLEEVRGLWSAGRLGVQAREALGYAQLIEHLEGRSTLEEAVERIKIDTRRFAKSQRTWLKRLRLIPGSVWIDAGATPRPAWAGVVAGAIR